MTVYTDMLRVKITRPMIDNYVSKRGIDTIFKPVDIKNNIWDVLFKTSDLSSEPSERLHKDDVEREVERFKIISERAKDLTLYVKSFGNVERMIFEAKEDDKKLDGIDPVRDESEVMGTYKDGMKQIRWTDKS